MCIGPFAAPKPPSPPPRMDPAPPQKPTPPPSELPNPEKLDDDATEANKVKAKRQALEVQRTRQGVKQFGAINPATTPTAPAQGITPPS
jgi:hypothetical protein